LGEHSVSSLAISRDGALLAVGNRDASLELWNTTTKTVRSFIGHEMGVSFLCFSADGTFLCSSSDEGSARCWDVQSGAVTLFQAYRAVLSACVPVANGLSCFGTGSYGDLYAWNRQGERLFYVHGKDTFARCIALSSDGQWALVGGSQSARLWDLTRREIVHDLEHQDRVTAVAFSPRDELLCTVGKDKYIKLWSQEAKLLYQKETPSPLRSVAFSPDGRRLLTTSDDDTARIWIIDSDWL
jgi:WD40 repeat protein